ncbi:MAG: polysaccharide deacetylase family protein [Lachnospiraceae bacterium]|nr:polysaccharide deacetylase family protein [Lachnospiraceae bacterium]
MPGKAGHFSERFPVTVFTCLTIAVLLITAYRSRQGAGATADGKDGAAASSAVFTEASALISSDVVPESDSGGSERSADEASGESDEEGLSDSGEFDEEGPGDSWEEAKRVALTFDDGPHPVYTVELLDGLAERGVCATFFVIGENIPGNEAIIERMDQEGHLIGNHTYDHVKISDLSVEEACEQVEKTSALIREITGKDTEYVRPPFGAWRKDLECSFEMFPVLWDVDPLDWTTKNTSDVVRRVLEATEPDDIILLHDCYDSSVEAALQIVDALTEQGYEFVTVDELILE